MLYIILPFIGLLSGHCKQDTPKPSPLPTGCLYCPADTPKVNVVWNVPNAPSYSEVHSMSPIITDYGVLFSTYFYKNTSEVIHLYDKNTGQLKWSWSDWYVPTDVSVTKFVRDNILIVVDWRYVYVIDISTGSTIWKDAQVSFRGSPRGWLIGNYIYHEWLNKIPDDTIAYLVRTKIDGPKWDTVLTLKIVNGYSPSIESVNLWMAPNGDSILLFQNRSYNFKILNGKIDLYAFNLLTHQVMWKLEDIDPSGNSDVNAIYIHNNNCYFLGNSALYSFDLKTGNKNWESKNTFRNLLFRNGLIFAKSNQDLLLCLNEATGSEAWRNEKSGQNPGKLEYYSDKVSNYNDKIYCLTGEGFFCYSARNGQTIFKYKSPNEFRATQKAQFAGLGDPGCPIDLINNRMYLADNYYVMCIEVP